MSNGILPELLLIILQQISICTLASIAANRCYRQVKNLVPLKTFKRSSTFILKDFITKEKQLHLSQAVTSIAGVKYLELKAVNTVRGQTGT